RSDIVVEHRAELADRVDGPSREVRVVTVEGDADLDRCPGTAERVGDVRGGGELVRGGPEVVRPALDHGVRLRWREGDRAVEDVRRRVGCEIEGGHDPEIAAAAADRPEQFGVLRGA